jgi:flavin-dependent dehydrogenase
LKKHNDLVGKRKLNELDVDIVIIGAGVGGCIAAIALAADYNIVVIDKLAEPPEQVGECLPGATRRILYQLGLLSEFEQQAHLQSLGMQSYWGSERLQYVDHLSNPDGYSWHLQRPLFESFLRDKAIKYGVHGMWPAKLIGSHYEDGAWCLLTDSGANIRTKFVIDAGGRQSPFARQQSVKRVAYDKLVSCWATISQKIDSNCVGSGVGLISAVESGWWYSSPIPNNKRVIAFQTDSDLLDVEIKKDFSVFIERALMCPAMKALLCDVSSFEMGKVLVSKDDGEYHGVISANSTRSSQVAGKQWAALGDSALSFDPLSSQGMFNAMATAMQLSSLIKNAGDIQVMYRRQIDSIWQHYMHHKLLYYRQEARWQDSPFWQRRR